MALNELMHQRNPYRKKPDFKSLAVKYPEFRKFVQQDIKGIVRLDFKSPESLRAISWVLLKEDWKLDVEMPLDRLIPTIPLRLNYLLWLEDVIGDHKDVHGIDIGAGASCVYALLGARKNNWKFLVSEVDPVNYDCATRNVEKNGLKDFITVHKMDKTSRLLDIIALAPDGQNFSFCMSNPPFFSNNLEAWGGNSRTDDRAEPRSVSTAAPVECIVSGGEVDFVKKMIDDSVKIKSRVRIYSAMLGRKTSLLPIKEALSKHKIANYGITEFCQGRTMRWGIGWTFDPDVKFPMRPSRAKASSKPKPPIIYTCPRSVAQQQGVTYDVSSIGQLIIGYLNQLKMIYEIESCSNESLEIEVVAVENTWIKQRQKRRREERIANEAVKNIKLDEKTQPKTPEMDTSGALPAECKMNDSGYDTPIPEESKTTTEMTKSTTEKTIEKVKDENSVHDDATKSDVTKTSQEEMDRMNLSVEDVDEYILKFSLLLKKEGTNIILFLKWIDGNSIELMQQVLQFFKNRIK